jgi:hypothetical protein
MANIILTNAKSLDSIISDVGAFKSVVPSADKTTLTVNFGTKPASSDTFSLVLHGTGLGFSIFPPAITGFITGFDGFFQEAGDPQKTLVTYTLSKGQAPIPVPSGFAGQVLAGNYAAIRDLFVAFPKDRFQSSQNINLSRLISGVELGKGIEQLELNGVATVGTASSSGTAISGALSTKAYTLTGNVAKDVLTGNALGDRLEGKGAADKLTGKGGLDKFVYSALTDSRFGKVDTITDYSLADKDQIVVPAALKGQKVKVLSFLQGTGAGPTSNALKAFLATVGANKVVFFGYLPTTTPATLTPYLFLNDGNAGFQSATDALVKLPNFIGDPTKITLA